MNSKSSILFATSFVVLFLMGLVVGDMLEWPTGLSLVLSFIVGGILSIVITLKYITKKEAQAKEQEEWLERERPKNEDAFFDRCVEAGIFHLGAYDMDYSTQTKVLNIAKACHLIPESEYFFNGQTAIMLRDVFHVREQTDEGKRKLKDKQKEIEKEKYQELTAYSDLFGIDKTLTMLNDTLNSLKDGASKPLGLKQPLKKSDGMIQAGMAAGIGGVIPAAASLVSTAEKNAQFEQYNADINAMNSMLVQSRLETETFIRKTQERIKRMTGKKVADLPKEEVFEKLCFKNTKIYLNKSGILQTGTLRVKTEASLQSRIKIDDIEYFVDGSLIAEIYQENQKIGEAILVLPSNGINYSIPVELEGMCLFCKEAEKASPNEVSKYTVKMVPGKYLWAMESLTAFENSQIGLA